MISLKYVFSIGLMSCVLLGPIQAADAPANTSNAKAVIKKGLDYLVAGQGSDGAWKAFDKSHPSITALVVNCIARDSDFGPKHPAAKRGIEYVLTFVQPDGGIYRPEDGQPNYQTSIALMALAAMQDPAHEKTIKEAQDYLKKLQWDDGEGHETSSPWFGGAGYGKHKRPDLSNTQFMLEALKQSGLPNSDPVYQKALVFVSRSQMFEETNDQPFAKDSKDGGFIYTPANDGESEAGTESVDDKPRLRSYGTMTYAGFKSMLYAKVDRSDLRIKKALEWMARHYTLDANPNMPEGKGNEGLFYYFHSFAKAMQAWGEAAVRDDRGVDHKWREELVTKLQSLQRPDGSWANEAPRWFEGNAHLSSAYAILALQATLE